MRAKDIIIGESYRLKNTPNCGYVKALKVCKPKEVVKEVNYIVIKCEHTYYKDGNVVFTRYFKPSDIVKDKS